MARSNNKGALLFLTFACAALAMLAAVEAYPNANLTCPPPQSYPKYVWDNLLPAPAGYTGTTNVTGYVLINTGKYNFQQASTFTGTFVQYYSRALGTYVSEYYIDFNGVAVMVLNITFSLLANEKNFGYNEACLIYNPASAVPQYQQETQMSDRFFYGTYYDKYDPRNPSNYGTVSRSEYFVFDSTKRLSSNCLTTFRSNVVTEMDCFEYVKISSIPSIKSAPAPSGAHGLLADGKDEVFDFLKGREVRHISEYKETFSVGKFRLPVGMLNDPSYKAYVDVAVAA
ncbi:hypothetical protein ml_492 [Mollivirus sibericum]|uniref:hypothetical protein n=1 Tax=Mollivirus sibericum TaxID=1678078 RepID=UPI0006B2EF55|nr:hypothetical protein ml_492 [Mollivirus sibericum]ALD62294.1 hypothetical protein ml_492 [Mollivirus sibericum]